MKTRERALDHGLSLALDFLNEHRTRRRPMDKHEREGVQLAILAVEQAREIVNASGARDVQLPKFQ